MKQQNKINWNECIMKQMKIFMICLLMFGICFGNPTHVYATTSGNNVQNHNSGSTNYSGTYSSSDYIKPGNYWFTPTVKYGDFVTITLPLVNMTPYNIKDIVITPLISGDKKSWPFEITQTNYVLKLDALSGEKSEPDVNKRTRDLFWTYKVRDDVLNGYYPITYEILYTDEACNQGSCKITTYVNCIGKSGAGSISGDDEDKKTSTPRIIVTGFETEPENVFAGENFMLNLHVKNTSSKTAIQNAEFDLVAAVEGTDKNATYAAFLPTSGSNTVYVDHIASGETVDINIEFTAKADLAQKPYVLDVKMKYEDMESNPYESTGSVSIPVKQQSKFETSSIEILPSDISIGNEANVMFSIYNTGKTKLYNVKAQILADSITGGDAFVGNLDSGATGSVDVMVTGAAATQDDGTLKVIVSYEDDTGKEFSEEFSTTLYVSEPMMEEPMPMEEEVVKPAFPRWAIIVIVIVVVLIAVIVIVTLLLRKKKKKKEAQLLIEDLEEDE
ncbi:MAG: hypothetical protein GX567_16835 [Clostridia bacterium]|nr:hypothetical protein [Clostridia bacterium]